VDEFARALRAVGEPIFGMDASRISMGRLLSYLFEVTERFGMETRTELILLQRTMVVVEGVSRSLSPNINIWTVSQPIVESYIAESIGPKALIRDLGRTLRVVGRFGPRLPQIVEAALIQQQATPKTIKPNSWLKKGALVLAGSGLLAVGVLVGLAL
jgi:ubiquinone biosynthesis protein